VRAALRVDPFARLWFHSRPSQAGDDCSVTGLAVVKGVDEHVRIAELFGNRDTA
jgi:hypothetical protein